MRILFFLIKKLEKIKSRMYSSIIFVLAGVAAEVWGLPAWPSVEWGPDHQGEHHVGDAGEGESSPEEGDRHTMWGDQPHVGRPQGTQHLTPRGNRVATSPTFAGIPTFSLEFLSYITLISYIILTKISRFPTFCLPISNDTWGQVVYNPMILRFNSIRWHSYMPWY